MPLSFLRMILADMYCAQVHLARLHGRVRTWPSPAWELAVYTPAWELRRCADMLAVNFEAANDGTS